MIGGKVVLDECGERLGFYVLFCLYFDWQYLASCLYDEVYFLGGVVLAVIIYRQIGERFHLLQDKILCKSPLVFAEHIVANENLVGWCHRECPQQPHVEQIKFERFHVGIEF